MSSVSTAPLEQAGFFETHKKWVIAFVIFGMYVSFGMSWIGVVPLREELNTVLGIGNAEGSRLISIVSMAKSFFPIIAGILAGRWGLTKTLRLSSLLIVMGIITPFLPVYWAMVALKFLFGIGGAIWVTLMGAVTMQVFPPEQRPLLNALNGVAITVGVVIALQFTVPLSAQIGWQWTLALYSLVSAVFMVLLFAVGELAPAAQAATDAKTAGPSFGQTLIAYTGTLKLPVTWLTSLAFAGPLALYLVLTYWLPIYYEEILEIPKLVTLQLMSWMNIGGIVGSVFTGLVLQKINKPKPFVMLAAFLLPAASVWALFSSSLGLLPLILFLAGVGLFMSVAPIITLLQGQPGMTPALVGMIMGTMFSITYILSYMAPEVVGMVYNANKGNLQWILIAFCLTTVSPILALKLKDT